MKQSAIVEKTAAYVKQKFNDGDPAHDWWHMYRVWQLAKTIAAQEKGANMLVVELGALLHDIADWKFHDGDTKAGPKAARQWLAKLKVDQVATDKIVEIVEHISYRGGTNKHIMQTLEAKIVQDADRLDALGAVGIGRTFAFGGARGRPLYDPNIPPQTYKDFQDFRAKIETTPTINHFYEKLLLLKDRLHTKTAKQLAERRHRYIEQFLAEFYAEWNGER